MSNRFNRRKFFGLAGGSLAAIAATPVFVRAQSSATPAAGDDQIEHPSGASDLVLRIEQSGGLIPPRYLLSVFPQFSLFGNGTVISEGPTTMIYPPKSLPNLRQRSLTEAGIQAILAKASAAGLMDGDKTYFNGSVMDAPTTVFTVIAGGKTTTVSAYGLGLGDDPQMSPEDKEAVATLVTFDSDATGIAGSTNPHFAIGQDENYVIERLQIVAEPIVPGSATPDDPSANQEPVDWPLPTSIEEWTPVTDLFGGQQTFRCGIIEGEGLSAVLAEAGKANTLTPWVSEGTNFSVSFRPLLPDESACPPHSGASAATPVAGS